MFEITNRMFYNGYVWLLSIYKGAAFYSVHKYEGSTEISNLGLSAIFQSEHDRQIKSLIHEKLINNKKVV